MLGNDAAFHEARERTAAYRDIDASTAPRLQTTLWWPPPDRKLRGRYRDIGNFQVLDGPVIAVRIATDFDIEPLRQILGSIAVETPGDHRFDYVLSRGGLHRLIIDDQIAMAGYPSEERPEPQSHGNPFVYLMSELLLRLLSHVPLLAVLHASAVVWRGKKIVFMGVSGSGKSTIAASLVGSGDARYLGDDIVPITRSEDIVPVPLAPSIKEGSWPIAQRLFPQLGEAGIFYKGTQPLKYLVDAPYAEWGGPPDLIVFPTFSRVRAPKSVRLTQIEVLLQISRAGLWVTPDNLDPLLDMLGGLPAIAMRHGPDPDQTRAILETHLEASD